MDGHDDIAIRVGGAAIVAAMCNVYRIIANIREMYIICFSRFYTYWTRPLQK